ncbi:hypothetical protein M436DRAFT_65383 [Aureobasidium namibiae CBS 147.97]|uniref:Uncharacterized protein n=1 Tax=Aureobasidium namibiae CBS 147.97 TaxID=1043004 RepID=A0A074WHX1_9PEZI|nr:uncharacterized protein M436DRAFT_65383 [Aureobasidium namibiae CBS 147.97]KEQ71224.1 hypothetical protein M436DRAFT_65383 [Aureobasidium namibiae CBS 147.97]
MRVPLPRVSHDTCVSERVEFLSHRTADSFAHRRLRLFLSTVTHRRSHHIHNSSLPDLKHPNKLRRTKTELISSHIVLLRHRTSFACRELCVSGVKRPLSSDSDSPVTKRVKKESFWGTSKQHGSATDHRVCVGCDSTTRPDPEFCDPPTNHLTLRSSRNGLEDTGEELDVKYELSFLDAQYEARLAGKNAEQSKEDQELHRHNTSNQTYLNNTTSPSPLLTSAAFNTSPARVPTSPRYSPLPTQRKQSLLCFHASPTRYEASPPPSSPSPSRPSPSNLPLPSNHTFESAYEQFDRRNILRLPPSPPRLGPLSSPCISSPAPMFFPQLSPRNDTLRASHTQEVRDILRGNELGDLTNIVPAPNDDVFNNTSSLRIQPSRLTKRKHDTYLPFHVKNPAKGVVSKWIVVALEEHKELIGYPCEDFKFRTEDDSVLGSWDRYGNIRDLERNIVH